MKSAALVLALAANVAFGALPALAQSEAAKPAAKAASATPLAELYPLGTCPISGAALGSMGDPIVKTYEGREVRFCCKSCPPKFEKDPAGSLAKLDEAIVKDQLPSYPLKTSVVSGKPLPEKPLDVVYKNRLVRLVDDAEKAEFQKDAAKYLTALDQAAIAEQSKAYPLTTCPVSNEKLGGMGEPKDIVVGGRLIRLCCNMCKKDLQKSPAKFIAMIDAARAGDAPPAAKPEQAETPTKK